MLFVIGIPFNQCSCYREITLYQREVDFHTIVAELETFWQSTAGRRMKSNLVRHVHEDGATNAQPTGKPNGIRHQLMRMMRLLEA